jgi:hypothetical protein
MAYTFGTTSGDGKDKLRTVGCVPTRDGRWHVTAQFAATCTLQKLLFVAAFTLACLVFLLGPRFGLLEDAGLRRRVRELERGVSRRLSWVGAHKLHLKRHLQRGTLWDEDLPGWAPEHALEDGRRHLWTAPNAPSRLAEALAAAGISTALPPVDDHYLCGGAAPSEDEVLRKKLAIAVVTWKAPQSLRNSLMSWQAGGLLDIADERMMFINSPSQEDVALAEEFDFDVYTTEELNGNIMAGPAIAYLVGNSSSDNVLFMEKDFAQTADRNTMLREMWEGTHALARGVEVYRLRGKTDFPAEGMPDCCAKTVEPNPPNCPFQSEWSAAGYFSTHQDWLRIWCVDDPVKDGRGQVVKCTAAATGSVDSYCFGSGSSNWSNNPLLMPVAWWNSRLREIAFRDWTHNNLLEYNIMMEWLGWRPAAKICVSYDGIFTHREIDQ